MPIYPCRYDPDLDAEYSFDVNFLSAGELSRVGKSAVGLEQHVLGRKLEVCTENPHCPPLLPLLPQPTCTT